MLLVYTQKTTPRISYIFKHICTRILGVPVDFTNVIEEFLVYDGNKFSYGKQALGNELFIQSHGLLEQQGFDSVDISVKPWEESIGFFATGNKGALPYDIFSSSFYMLSRYEEYLPHVKDDFGRFMASESLAFKEDFLQQPVVDIWAYKLKNVLMENFPALVFPEKSMTTHTIVEAAQPFAYIQKGFFRSIVGYANDIFKLKFRKFFERTQVVLGLRRDPFDSFKWMMNRAKRNNLKLTVFFMLGDSIVFEESLNTHRQEFKLLVKFISDYKEAGLMFSFDALKNYDALKREKDRMEEITNRTLRSSINAQYLVNLPEIYRNLVELEVQKDFTMLFRDTVGFRAGTCTPFLFYDLDYEIKTPLVIHPIALTTFAFDKKYESEINKTISHVMSSVEAVNGTFSMLFSNKDFFQNERNTIWRNIFSEKLLHNES